LGKDFWMKDENATECFGCSKNFTAWRRKHHCRICGQIFCSSCTDLIPGNKFNYTGRMRVCYCCLERIDDYGSSSDTSSNFDPNETMSSDIMGDPVPDSPVKNNSTFSENGPVLDVIIPQDDVIQPAPLMAIPAARNGTAVEIPLKGNSMPLYRVGSTRGFSRKTKERNNLWDGSRTVSRDHFFPRENLSFTRFDNDLLDNIQDDYVGNDSFVDKEDTSDATYESEEEDEHAMSLLSSLQLDNPSEKQQSLEMLRNNAISSFKHNSTVWRPRRGTNHSIEQGKLGISKSKIRSKSFIAKKRNANTDINKKLHSAEVSGTVGSLNSESSIMLPSKPFRLASVKANVGGSSELNQASRIHSKNFLKQLLEECEIENVEKWIEALTTPLLQCAENIDLDIRGGDSLDIRQYVQLKKIEGGVPKDIAYICGVVFSKSLALKTMPRDISNPRIALIMFPIEYRRTSRNFMSLEPILAQEKEYIRKLAKRIISLSPDIVLAGSTVNGHALDLLAKAGIAVAYNVKESVITKVARYTKADVIWSIDKLAVNPKLGFCESFSVKTYRYKNVTKTYFIFSGCAKQLGCTILLRGADERILSQVKMCVEFMVYVIFSLKLETSVLRDEFVLIPNYTVKAETKGEDSDEKEDSAVNFFHDVVKFQATKILSSSPSVQFSQPYLLTQARDLEDKLVEINESVSIEKTAETRSEEPNNNTNEASKIIDLSKYNLVIDVENLPGGNGGLKKIMETINYENYQRLYNLWSAQKNQLELSFLQSPEMFTPKMHQNITVLYSLVSNITATPCVGPEITNMEFYKRTDLTLGQFIEGLCLSVNSSCRFEDDHGGVFGCEEPLINHYRSYVHGRGRINVIVEKFECRIPGMQNTILMWSYCRKCKVNVPVIPMSENTWKYSFGKYLELSFWSTNVQMRAVPCNHNVFRDHVRFFGLYDYVVRFEYETTDVLELVVPSTKMVWRPESDIQIKYDQFVYIQKKINRFWESVIARFARVKIDGLSEDRVDEFKLHVENLRTRANEELKQAVEMLNDLYIKTRSTEHLPLNRVLSFVQDMAVQWDMEFLNFESNFFPSEKDITRITAQQLRKIFTDKNEDPNEKLNEKLTEKTDLDNSSLELLDSKANARDKDENIEGIHESNITGYECGKLAQNESKNLTNDSDLRKYNTISERENGSLEKDEVLSREANENSNSTQSIADSIDIGASKSPTTTTFRKKMAEKAYSPAFPFRQRFGSSSKDLERHLQLRRSSTTHSRVSSLARHFDQLSLEFEKERAKERRLLAEGQFRAFPVANAKPIIEVYDSVEDAVEELSASEDEDQIIPEEPSRLRGLNPENGGDYFSYVSEQSEPNTKSFHQNDNEEIKEENDNCDNTASVSENLKDEISTTNCDSVLATDAAPDGGAGDLPQISEKQSLLRTLANFWADRSATGWNPLEYPLMPSEHIFVDSDVMVREDEPSSLIAFCLSSSDYLDKLHSLRQNETNAVDDNSSVHVNFDNSQIPELERWMGKPTATHLKYRFGEGSAKLMCKIFYPEQFDAFRIKCGCDEHYIQSLSRCVKWDSSGGKSGSAFLKTLNDRLVIKQLSQNELDAFIKFAPNYFEYMSKALFHDLPTVLAKIFGFYQIQIKNPLTNKAFKMDVLVMENLFYKRKPTRIFDLKGSMRNRHVKQTGRENEVLLDENMVEYIYESPLFVREHAKRLLRASLWNDTLFLAQMNVMDYSLVIGIDSEKDELVVGIIDCMRTFTWDKKLESWVKERGLVGGGNKEPTVVTPKQYKNRFREAMERYILMVPDYWYR
ncbi:hypothetical protein NADFUDRAFT_12892, partial [Nadsonia fulvescens var. elongata DSM 6958]